MHDSLKMNGDNNGVYMQKNGESLVFDIVVNTATGFV